MTTIKEIKEYAHLNEKCRNAKIYQWNEFKAKLYYYVSLPLTKILLILKVSPNSITLLYLLFALAGSILIGSGKIDFVILGVILIQLCVVFDFCDGAVARLTNNCTNRGFFLDWAIPFLIQPLFWIGLTFYCYVSYNNVLVFILGFIIFISLFSNFSLLSVSFIVSKQICRSNDSSKLKHENGKARVNANDKNKFIKRLKTAVMRFFFSNNSTKIDMICAVVILGFYVKYIDIVFLMLSATAYLLIFIITTIYWFYKNTFEKQLSEICRQIKEGVNDENERNFMHKK